MTPKPLPPEAQRLCDELAAPERLRRHLILVHDVAADLVERLAGTFPAVVLDYHSITLGAAIHDIGKMLHPEELVGPGRLHEIDGPHLLEQHGIPPAVAKYARTHGTWKDDKVELADLVVALADNLWRGRRNQELETKVVEVVSTLTGQDRWAVFERLDDIFEHIAAEGDRRLAWQAGGGS